MKRTSVATVASLALSVGIIGAATTLAAPAQADPGADDFLSSLSSAGLGDVDPATADSVGQHGLPDALRARSAARRRRRQGLRRHRQAARPRHDVHRPGDHACSAQGPWRHWPTARCRSRWGCSASDRHVLHQGRATRAGAQLLTQKSAQKRLVSRRPRRGSPAARRRAPSTEPDDGADMARREIRLMPRQLVRQQLGQRQPERRPGALVGRLLLHPEELGRRSGTGRACRPADASAAGRAARSRTIATSSRLSLALRAASS